MLVWDNYFISSCGDDDVE